MHIRSGRRCRYEDELRRARRPKGQFPTNSTETVIRLDAWLLPLITSSRFSGGQSLSSGRVKYVAGPVSVVLVAAQRPKMLRNSFVCRTQVLAVFFGSILFVGLVGGIATPN